MLSVKGNVNRMAKILEERLKADWQKKIGKTEPQHHLSFFWNQAGDKQANAIA